MLFSNTKSKLALTSKNNYNNFTGEESFETSGSVREFSTMSCAVQPRGHFKVRAGTAC